MSGYVRFTCIINFCPAGAAYYCCKGQDDCTLPSKKRETNVHQSHRKEEMARRGETEMIRVSYRTAILVFVLCFSLLNLPSRHKLWLPSGSTSALAVDENESKSNVGARDCEAQQDSLAFAEPSVASSNHTTLYELLNTGQKIFLYEMGEFSKRNGFGSLTLTVLHFRAYYQRQQENSRTLVLDQSHSKVYRRNETHGLYTGFLQTDFLVIDKIGHVQAVIQQQQQQQQTLASASAVDVVKVSHQTSRQHLQFIRTFRTIANANAKIYNEDNLAMFADFVRMACAIQLTAETQAQIVEELNQRGIPLLDNLSMNNRADASLTRSYSVAFHIRRGDKLIKESRAFSPQEYINALTAGISPTEKAAIQHCYVATDDYRVVDELAIALRSASIACPIVHTLAGKDYDTNRNGHHALQLFVDLKMLVDATFFVGSISSSIGRMVSLWRGCRTRPQRCWANRANKFHHYYRSYYVDAEDWQS